MKNIKKFLFVLVVLFSVMGTVYAEEPSINLTIRNSDVIIFSRAVTLQSAETIELQGHSLNAKSVLSVLNDADNLSSDFNISNLEYYDAYSSFYLKCITSSVGNDCDNWQYMVNDIYPGIGMDQKILSGGENIYLYFGPQNKTILDSNNINTNNTLTVTTQKYDYQNNSWITRTGVTVGLTQPDPNNPWSPTEVKTNSVNENGQAVFAEIPVGFYNVGIKEDFYFPIEVLTVTTPPVRQWGGGGIIFSPPAPIKAKFDLQKAFKFLISQQKEDGSFGEDLYTDWTTLAFSSNENYEEQKTKLRKYLSEIKTTNYQLTDYERHVMALMTLDINPYNINGENYIKKIVDSFDGKQFGDKEKDNDDIFALIVLQNAGFTQEEKTIKDSMSFILSNQKKNGSWDESIDMTGAAMQAITASAEKSCFILGSLSVPAGTALPLGSSTCETPQNKELFSALAKAKEFLKQNQKNDGGFGNISSTAWAIGGILALSEKPEDWIKNENSPLDYLANNQDIDGGVKDLSAQAGENLQNKIWQTAYIVTALSGKTWNQIMQKFDKPKEEIIEKAKEAEKQIVEKRVEKKIVKKSPQKLVDLKKQNTASVINAITENTEKTLPIKKNWFRNLLDKIFSFF